MKKPAKPTAKKGSKGDAPFRIADPSSGRQLIRGRPVDNAGPYKEGPHVKDPSSGEPMKKGSPVETAYSGSLNQRIGLGLKSAAQAAFFPEKGQAGGPPSGKGDPGGKVRKSAKKKR